MINNKQKTIIDEMYYKIARVTEGGHYFDKLHDMVKTSEKGHRAFGDRKHGLPFTYAVKYFCCKYVLEGKGKAPSAKSAHYMRLECFVGYGIYHEYKARFIEKISRKDVKEFNTLDYADMMEVK
tara:strand:+ start:2106 stop:2477 length:372 start_codon:yes stop_codon:yes gene_type:complete